MTGKKLRNGPTLVKFQLYQHFPIFTPALQAKQVTRNTLTILDPRDVQEDYIFDILKQLWLASLIR